MGARSLVQRSRKSGFGETQDVFRVHCLAEIEKEREKLGLGLGFFRFLADVKDEHFFFLVRLRKTIERTDFRIEPRERDVVNGTRLGNGSG